MIMIVSVVVMKSVCLVHGGGGGRPDGHRRGWGRPDGHRIRGGGGHRGRLREGVAWW